MQTSLCEPYIGTHSNRSTSVYGMVPAMDQSGSNERYLKACMRQWCQNSLRCWSGICMAFSTTRRTTS